MAVKTISGSNLVLGVDLAGGSSFTAVGGSTTCTLSINQETIDVTNKDSQGNKEFINGARSWTLDCEAYFTDGTSDGADIPVGGDGTANSGWYPVLESGDKIKVQFSNTTGQTGARKYTGDGYITSISVNAGISEWSTYSVSIQGTGALTDAAV
tara:strand:+ start:971 stop:1432 length:462 start_codon:yes stop_codon:yes gene_type:complete